MAGSLTHAGQNGCADNILNVKANPSHENVILNINSLHVVSQTPTTQQSIIRKQTFRKKESTPKHSREMYENTGL